MTRNRPNGRHLSAILALALTLAAVPTAAGADPADDSGAAAPAPAGDGALGSDTSSPAPSDSASPSPDDDNDSTSAPTEPDQSSPPSTVDSSAPTSPSTTTPTDSTPPGSAPSVTTPPSSWLPDGDESPTTTSPDPHVTGEPSASTTAPTRPTAPVPVAPVADTEGHHHDEMDPTASPMPAPLPGDLRDISFPVLGPVTYTNDWGACRDGCSRHHEGNDLIGVRMQPLLAAADGTITRIRYENVGTAGAIVTLTDGAGWAYNYFHVNNDRPGSDDGAAGPEWQVPRPLQVGDAVRAGQVIAYMGDSGNSESSVPHLHFEIRRPDDTPVNPYPSLQAAQRRETCAGTDGTWSSPTPADVPAGFVTVVPLGGDGRWIVGPDGRLFAEGTAARIQPMRGIDCPAAETPTEEAPPVSAVPQQFPPQSPSPDESPEQPPSSPEGSVEQALSSPEGSVEQPLSSPLQDLESEAPAPITWTVREGQSLWEIVRSTYGATDDHVISALVDTIFQNNRDQLTDPDVLTISMVLQLPPATA